MNIEDKYTELMSRFKTDAAAVVKDITDSIHSDLLPHIENDTVMNVDLRAQEAVNNLIAGSFDRVSESHVSVKLHSGIHIPIKITANQFDNARKSLIEVMGACPKGLEIAAFKDQIKFIQNK